MAKQWLAKREFSHANGKIPKIQAFMPVVSPLLLADAVKSRTSFWSVSIKDEGLWVNWRTVLMTNPDMNAALTTPVRRTKRSE
jgi:hypothetical protein